MASTAGPARAVARIPGADGHAVTVAVDCDGAVLCTTGRVVLDHGGQEDFARAWSEAVRQAGEWAERYGGGDG